MHGYLEKILKRKEEEIRILQAQSKSLKKALKQQPFSVIAEIKRASPSKGNIGRIADPISLAKQYLEGGAAAISILTDREGFGGGLEDLSQVSQAFPESVLLRKDFLIHPLQLEESLKHGARCVLLIVSALGIKTKEMLREAEKLRLDALVEVHDENELKIALDAGAELIGINNRNLSTFQVDLNVCRSLAPHIPQGILKIAESGISSKEDASLMRELGFDAVLVGEALVRAENPTALIQEMLS